jgi:geranylgeranyl transferase type-2 subunit beta
VIAATRIFADRAYWALAAMDLMNVLEEMPKTEIIEWIVRCQHKTGVQSNTDADPKLVLGGFGGNIGHDQHLLYTLSALQILAMFDALDGVDCGSAATFVASLQREGVRARTMHCSFRSHNRRIIYWR